MKKFLYTMMAFSLMMGATAFAKVQSHSHKDGQLCEGFAKENNQRIPASQRSGISEEDYNAVLDKISTIYTPEFASLGSNLVIDRLWTNATVNASASRSGKNWKISMYGGMARHPSTTKDGFALVACHEIGHHVGGAPRKLFMWASNEGQSDYYATLKCFRRYVADEDNSIFITSEMVTPFMRSECMNEFTEVADQAVCMRAALGGLSIATVLQDLNNEKLTPNPETPDKKVVMMMMSSHPPAQCRMDTYFNGARCPVSVTEAVSADNYKDGTCDKDVVANTGSRPRCWFKP